MEIERPGSSKPWNVSVPHSLVNTPTNHAPTGPAKKSIAIEDHLFRPSSKRTNRANKSLNRRNDFNQSINSQYKCNYKDYLGCLS